MDGHRVNINTLGMVVVDVVQDETTLRIPGSIKMPKSTSKQSLQKHEFEFYWPRPCTLTKGKGTTESPLPYYHSTYKETK